MLEMANNHMEESLDIRSFMRLQTRFNILVNLLLTDEQKVLFNYQRARLVRLTKADTDDGNSDNEL